MKLIIVLHCSMLKLANAPSLRLYTHACDLMFEKSFDCTERFTTYHYSCHLHPQNQSREKAHEAYPYWKSSQVYLFFPTFDSDNAISREATMSETIPLDSFMGVKLSFAKIFAFSVKLCSLLSILLSFFLLNKTFL